MSDNSLPSVFVPHGAGPCFFMDWNPPGAWDRMEAWLRGIGILVGAKPKAILVVSAHWEEAVFTVNAQAKPGLLYDYYGFPEHTYQIEWPARGAPALAAEVRELLEIADIESAEDHDRGLDHGVFIPMKLAFPDADIPVLQLSLRSGLDPAEHIALGRALMPLRRKGVLIIGSGMSYHNMAQLQRGTAVDPESLRFDAWLAETVAMPSAVRERRLVDWVRAPGGRASHPVEEHLLPLHVVVGAAGEGLGAKVFEDTVLGSVQSGFLFVDPYDR